ncbi:MAG: hypothetical protein R6V00_02770 [Candidatus Aminicenantes bacterium]
MGVLNTFGFEAPENYKEILKKIPGKENICAESREDRTAGLSHPLGKNEVNE